MNDILGDIDILRLAVEAIPAPRRAGILNAAVSKYEAPAVHLSGAPLDARVEWRRWTGGGDHVLVWEHHGACRVFGLATRSEAESWGCPAPLLAAIDLLSAPPSAAPVSPDAAEGGGL